MGYTTGAVDVIIPTYKPDERLVRLVELLEHQSYSVRRIIIINTEIEYWKKMSSVMALPSRFGNVVVNHICSADFDHGKTRGDAVKNSDAEFVVMMTQDALPYDESLIEKLIAPLLADKKVAVSYARQLPNSDATVTERYIRAFNYPAKSRIKKQSDEPKLGIKTYFCSNVCAAYNHEIYDKLGGFVKKTIFNEDMIFAGTAVKAGYFISYTAEAQVYHSHNYSGLQQLHRNFDLAVSQEQNPEIFASLKSESEGIKLLGDMKKHLRSIHKIYLFPGFLFNCGCRYIGFKLGHMYKRLPKGLVLKLTSNKMYWK